jgi:hypothetical protein
MGFTVLMILYEKSISRETLKSLGVPHNLAASICKGNRRDKKSHYGKAQNVPPEILRLIRSFVLELEEAKQRDLDLGYKKKVSLRQHSSTYRF